MEEKVKSIINSKWEIRDGLKVPETDDIALGGGGVRLEATVLYADLSQSSKLASDFDSRTAAKVVKSFLYCASRIIRSHDGIITAFDGDRVMGIFLGGFKNSNSAKCALNINYVVQKIIRPSLTAHFTSLRESGFEIRHAVGIDTSSVLAVRAGMRGSNDLVWVGRAPNFAAKLSSIRNDRYPSYITDDVFTLLKKWAKYDGKGSTLMWEPRSLDWLGEKWSIHRSSWDWKPA